MPTMTKAEIAMIVEGENMAQYAPEPGDEIEMVLKAANRLLVSTDYAAKDVMESLGQAMRGGWADFGNMFAEDFEMLFTHLSKEFPDAVFRLRCAGSSEFGEIYLREFKAGCISISIGPFDI